MKRSILPIILLATVVEAQAQSAIERHIWRDARSFEPISRTAEAITGTIALSGNPEFALPGSSMSMTFETGATVELTSEGASWRTWDAGGSGKQTAEVFRLSSDPGPLLSDNTLCGTDGNENSLFAVFFEQSLFGSYSLGLAVFQSAEPPFDIDSPGLCGTFSYAIDSMRETVDTAPSGISASEHPGAGESGAWVVRTSTNPLDDTQTVTLSLASDVGTSRRGRPFVLVARCKSNRTEVYVVWGDYVGNDSRDVDTEWKLVTVRVGTGTARTERWDISTDRAATFAPAWAGSFLKELLAVERLVLQTVPYGERPYTAIFDVSGLRGVLGALAGTCNWSF